MRNEAPRWRDALKRLERVARAHGQAIELRPCCSDNQEQVECIARIESQLGCALPPSVRELLCSVDGCDNLFRNARLYSLRELQSPMCQEQAKLRMPELHTPVPSPVAANDQPWRDTPMLCIGADESGNTVFMLDPSVRRSSGEMDVIGWFSGLGVRLPSLASLLSFLADMIETTCGGPARLTDSRKRSHGSAFAQMQVAAP